MRGKKTRAASTNDVSSAEFAASVVAAVNRKITASGPSTASTAATPDVRADEVADRILAEVDHQIATAEWLRIELQPIYGRLLARNGVDTGNIDSLTLVRLEEAEDDLAQVLHEWMMLATGKALL